MTDANSSDSNSLTLDEKQFINEARRFLENPSFLIRAANLVGKPLERGLKMLPALVQSRIQAAVRTSVERGLVLVTKSVKPVERTFTEASAESRRKGLFHTAASFGTGALGGFFGVASLPIELPVTTAIMLRSIVSTAQDYGHDISDPEVQLECLYVLSLGAPNEPSSDEANAATEGFNSAYWTSRLAFTDLIRHAAREIERSSAPFLVRFLATVASRFELVVSEKALAEVLPVIGAIGGGTINAAFTDHFNKAARYHFGLRALERKYSEAVVRGNYLAKP